MDICKINSILTLKFNTILESDIQNPNVAKFYKTQKSCDGLYEFNGSLYYKVHPTSYLSLDFQEPSRYNEESVYNPYRTININKMFTFLLIREIKKSIEDFHAHINSNTPIFWYDEQENLKYDPGLAKSISVNMNYMNRHIELLYTVREVEDATGTTLTPGCVLFSHSIADSVFLTLEEYEYLLYQLERVDFNQLSLQLIDLAYRKKYSINQTQNDHVQHIRKISSEPVEPVCPNETQTFTPVKKPESIELDDI